jgi:hypothetical protein
MISAPGVVTDNLSRNRSFLQQSPRGDSTNLSQRNNQALTKCAAWVFYAQCSTFSPEI